MFAPTKRRLASYYFSLLLVTAIVFFVVTKLAAWQRAAMVADLANRVAHREVQEAAAALRQLAAMPRPPVEILVAAATSADQAIASEARYVIGDLLRRWQRQVESERRLGVVARQLADLADALTQRQPDFSPSDYRWLRSTAGKILRLANRMPESKSPLVAAQCDSLLAAITTAEMSAASFIERKTPVTGQVAKPVRVDDGAAPAAGEMEAKSNAFVVQPFVSLDSDASHDSQSIDAEEAEPATQSEPVTPPRPTNQTSPPLKWTHPMLHGVPAMPIIAPPPPGSGERSTSPPSPTTPPDEKISADDPLPGASPRELLARWLDADGSEVFPLEEELTRRGFGRLSDRLVEPLFSEDVEQRLRLVDDVLMAPGVDARPWLMLLAEDTDADVRLLAVTIMATSDDRALIDKAWHVAIRDRDPRIAGLADRLRERRESAR